MVAGVVRTCRFGPIEVAFDDGVLEPRPWTLAQSRWAAELAADATPGPLLELCAGAGHIGLAAAVLADRDLVQVELDPHAAGFARANAERAGWGDRVEVRATRLEDALHPGEQFPLVLADPPYLPTAAVGRFPHDPLLAIDGGPDGLSVVRACLVVAADHLGAGAAVLLQVAGPRQADAVAALTAEGVGGLGYGDLRYGGLRCEDQRVVDDERAVVLLRTRR